MTHSKDCTAGLSDIDPTCEACIQQRLDRSRGYPPLSQARAGVTPLGQCISDQEWDDYADDMSTLRPWNESIK